MTTILLNNLENNRYFELSKSLFKEDLKGDKRMESHQKASELVDRIITNSGFLAEEKLQILKNIDEKQLNEYKQDLVRKTRPRSLIMGNLSKNDASKIAKQVKAVKAASLQPAYLFRPGSYVYQTSAGLNSHAVLNRYDMGATTPKRLAVAVMLHILLQEATYDELRNKQQLGYYAAALLDTRYRHLALEVVVQGAQLTPTEMDARITSFLANFKDELWYEDASFLSNVANSAAEALRPAPTFPQRRSSVWKHILNSDFEFNEREEATALLAKVTKADLIETLESFLEDSQVLSVQVFAGELQSSPRQDIDLDSFQSSSFV